MCYGHVRGTMAAAVMGAVFNLPGRVEHDESGFCLADSRGEVIVAEVEDIGFAAVGEGHEERQAD